MKFNIILLTLLFNALVVVDLFAQVLPLVYDVENTGINCPIPYLPVFQELPIVQPLPDPFMWSDGRDQISNFSDWRYRRAEIGAEIQNYEIGLKSNPPDSIQASYLGTTLTVIVTVDGRSFTLTSEVILPAGTGPFPAVIGMNSPSGSLPSNIFSSRDIVQITFNHDQVTKYTNPQNSDPYYWLYPDLNLDNTGQYSAWAWGVSRIIDGLELVQTDLPVDMSHIAVTGCSYAGKMALFAGAFDERIALTIAQESGGGGATSWRYSHSEPNGTVEKIDNTNYNWFRNSMNQFSGDKVWRMPEDHHELMAMVAPRALLVTGNPDYTWLSNPSCYVCSEACKEVYDGLGISDRFGYSIVGGHLHCLVSSSQIPEVEAFVDKFLLGDTTVNTNITTQPGYTINLSYWIPWTAPALSNDSSYFGKTTLVYPSDNQTELDTTITFKWNAISDVQKYFIQVSIDPTFVNVATIDSTSDTLKTISGLLKGKLYYWRVQVKSAAGSGPWSNVGHFSTAVPLPAAPELISVSPYPNRPSWFTFTWRAPLYADEYYIQTATDSAFVQIFKATTAPDTSIILTNFVLGEIYYWRVRANNIAGYGPWSEVWSFDTSVDVDEEGKIPTEYWLSQNYPNPFNPITKINYSIPTGGYISIKVYNLLGQVVATLINGEQRAGNYSAIFDGTKLSSGIYFYRLEANNFIAIKKLVLLQ